MATPTAAAFAGSSQRTELQFSHRADEGVVRVKEISSVDARDPNSGSKELFRWDLRLKALGPDVDFDLKIFDGDDGFDLTLKNVALGCATSKRLTIAFRRSGDTWRLGVTTDLFGNISLSPITFSSFCNDKRLQATADRKQLQPAILAMFDGHIACDDAVELSLDRHLVWWLRPLKGTRITTFSGQVSLKDLCVFWGDTDQIAAGSAPPVVVAKTSGASTETIAVGIDKGFRLRLHPDSDVEFLFRTPGVDDRRAEISIRAARWIATFEDANGLVAGDLPLEGAISRQFDGQEAAPGKGLLVTRLNAGFSAPEFAFESRIGRLRAATPESGQEAAAAIASGDPRPASLVAIGSAGKAGLAIQQVNVAVQLLAANITVPDAAKTSLTFDHADFHLVYSTERSASVFPSSYLWLGDRSADPELPNARIDLTRASLEAARAADLLSLTFRFADLALVFRGEPRIEALPDQCRAIVPKGVDEGSYVESRPVLVVEFPPQHVLEKALFQIDLPPLPIRKVDVGQDVKPFYVPGIPKGPFSPDPEELVRQLVDFTERQRQLIRKQWLDETEPKSKDNKPIENEFRRFADDYADMARAARLPNDQRIYIGPYGLDFDAMAIARATMTKRRTEEQSLLVDQIMDDVKEQSARLTSRDQETAKEAGVASASGIAGTMDQALAREHALEAAVPAYQFFREFYRSALIESLLKDIPEKNPVIAHADRATTLAQSEIEYFYETNRVAATKAGADANLLIRRSNSALASYKAGISGADRTPPLVPGRLSERSRLAFRVNCGPPGNGFGNLVENDTDRHIAFTLDGLTNWSSHDLSVVRRSQHLFGPTTSGLLPTGDDRRPDLDDIRMLRFQGFRPGGFTTAQQRLAAVAATLRPPGPLETSIELPARVILSTAQDAIWRTPQYFSRDVFWRKYAAGVCAPLSPKGGLRATSLPDRDDHRTGQALLWSASIDPEAADPGLRVVHSPDFRPEFLWAQSQRLASKAFFSPDLTMRLPGNGAPPRGPFAPWLLGREDTSNPLPLPLDIATHLGPNDRPTIVPPSPPAAPAPSSPDQDKPAPGDPFCDSIDPQNRYNGAFRLPALIGYLCGRFEQRRVLADDILFRSSLDAYDRHELVLLSSAYGLPVLGRRDESFGLLKGSSQFEPGKDYELADVLPGSAIYRPKTLDLRELTLTAIGGTLRHDTSFVPPAAAMHLDSTNLFDALSIERWQHWAVLGRDIFTEVVYKGFLFPLGHRASLVKLTERTFMRAPAGRNGEAGGIKAFLKQHMFIRCGKPEKSYPALRQPNGGREFPVTTLRILTVRTPDIVDPMSGPEALLNPAVEGIKSLSASGRLVLSQAAGLAFWPRTALTPNADVQFDMQLDGRVTRMPLIFVDNTAAHDAHALKAIAAYYNIALQSPDDQAAGNDANPLPAITRAHKRTIALGGQKTRYCDERKAGDSSHETDTWTLKVRGRNYAANDLEGKGDTFDFDPIMEGADQPPFYPAVQTARVRLRQAERFIGRPTDPAIVQFDGHYIANGFKTTSDTTGKDVVDGNASEVYLNLIKPVAMTVGNNGDRTGGVFRTEADLLNIGRLKGPLGGNRSEQPVMKAGTLVARADLYDRVPHPATDTSTLTKAYERYFSADTKLLGLIKVSKLLKYMNLPSPEEGLPMLKEAVVYGVAVAGGAAEEASEVSGDVRVLVQHEVIEPLLKVVEDANRQWSEAQREIADAQGLVKGQKPVTLDRIFPEVASGLGELERALNTALGTTSTVAFTAALADIFEAGRQLMSGLEQIAANPTAHVEAALREEVDGWVGQIEQVAGLAENLVSTIADAWPAALADQIIDAVIQVEDGKAHLFETLFPPEPAVPYWPDLQATFDEAWKDLAPTPDNVRPLLQPLLTGGQGTDGAFKSFGQAMAPKAVNAAKRIEDAVEQQKARTNPSIWVGRASAVAATLHDLAKSLDALDTQAAAATVLPPTIFARLLYVRSLGAELDKLKSAAQAKNVGQAASSALALIELVAGTSDVLEQVRTGANKAFAAIKAAVITDLRAARVCQPPDLSKKDEQNFPFETLPATKADGTKTLCHYFYLATSICTGWLKDTDTLYQSLAGKKDFRDFADAFKAVRDAVTEVRNSVNRAHAAALNDSRAINNGVDELGKASDVDIFDENASQAIRLQLAMLTRMAEGRVRFVESLAANTQAIVRAAEDFAKRIETFPASTAVVNSNLFSAFSNARLANDITSAKKKVGEIDKQVALSLRDALVQEIGLVSEVAASLTTDSTTAKALKSGLDTLTAVVPSDSPLRNDLDQIGKSLTEIRLTFSSLKTAADTLQEWKPASGPAITALLDTIRGISKNPSDSSPFSLKAATDALRKVDRAILDVPSAVSRTLAGLGTAFVRSAFDGPVTILIGDTAPGAGPGSIGGIADIYGRVAAARTTALVNVEHSGLPTVFKEQLRTLLTVSPTRPPVVGIAPSGDQLARDLESLGAIHHSGHPISDVANRAWLSDFVRGWRDGNAVPLKITNQVKDFSLQLLRGEWFKLIDFSSIRDDIENHLKSLIPKRATLSHAFGGKFTGKTKEATAGIFDPTADSGLDVTVEGSVEFQRPQDVRFDVVGKLGPFAIKLVGDLVDAVTINFRGAVFTTGAARKAHLAVDYDSFEIGKDLEHVQELASIFGPSDGSGFYLLPRLAPLGIEAGYGLNLPIISMGDVSFFNISLNAALVIPFEAGSDARFRASLSRRDAPFTISAAPYGGSGFFAIEANAEGLVGFEASFEFGGAAAFHYGPLSGMGRLMAGVYIRQMTVQGRRSTELSGTFFVGGSVSIWIFSFGASLYVRLAMVPGGAMQGEATFTFSFSIGIAHFDYSVTVSRNQPKVGSSESTSLDGMSEFLVAGPTMGVQPRPQTASNEFNSWIFNNTKCQGVDWPTYRNYFDAAIVPDDLHAFEVSL